MIDIVVCTNAVNLCIAWAGAQPGRDRPALLLYEPWRITLPPRQPHGAPVWPMAIGIWSLRLALMLARLGRVHTLYLPHDRFNQRIARTRALARRVVYLDDGLDTHRQVPRNMALPPQPCRDGAPPGYLTFHEFDLQPPWLRGFAVRRCASLALLAGAERSSRLDLDGVSHLLVESPGLDVAMLVQRLALPAQSVLVLRHPVPDKRGAIPAACRTTEGAGHDLEAALLRAVGMTLVFGETLSLVFAHHMGVAARNTVLAQLTPAQRDNLPVLRWQPAPTSLYAEMPGLMQLAP